MASLWLEPRIRGEIKIFYQNYLPLVAENRVTNVLVVVPPLTLTMWPRLYCCDICGSPASNGLILFFGRFSTRQNFPRAAEFFFVFLHHFLVSNTIQLLIFKSVLQVVVALKIPSPPLQCFIAIYLGQWQVDDKRIWQLWTLQQLNLTVCVAVETREWC